ncbi:MAG: endonuclease/exonuclease/phosphatase family protein [Rhodospirillales bacterium]
MPDGERPKTTLRLLTWNLHGFVGSDGVHDPERICRIVREIAPDIAAFQEVDIRGVDADAALTESTLRDSVGPYGANAWSIAEPGRRYGLMLASRLPLAPADIHDLSVERREPRRAIETRIDSPDLPVLRIIATHLGLAFRERREQHARLHRIIGRDDDVPVAVMGDFNNWIFERRIGGLAGIMPERTRERTWPARLPFLPLDRVWLRPAGLLHRSRRYGKYRAASDHLPLVAEIGLPPAAPLRPGTVRDGLKAADQVTG